MVVRPHGNHQDVGSNSAMAKTKKRDIGQTPAQKVPQKSGRISVEDRRCKAELDLEEKNKKTNKNYRLAIILH